MLNDRLVRKYEAALVFVLLLVAPSAVRGADPKTAATANGGLADISRIQIDNFGRISATYYRGGQPTGRDYQDLAALGIKTLVNLTSDDAQADEQAMARQAGMNYYQIPMSTHRSPTAIELSEFLHLVNDPANQPVYVHCVGGRHRTGVMTAAYRMSQDGWSADQAFKEMKQYKFGADFLHPEFKDFVYTYHAGAVNADAAQTSSTRSAR